MNFVQSSEGLFRAKTDLPKQGGTLKAVTFGFELHIFLNLQPASKPCSAPP